MRKVVIILAGLAVAVTAWLKTPDHAYRLTMEVETPEGLRKASGVFHVWADRGWLSTAGIPVGGGTTLKGDALFLDLGGGRSVVALLAHFPGATDVDSMGKLALYSIEQSGRRVGLYDVHTVSGRFPVRGKWIPTLMSFVQPSVPESGRPVMVDGPVGTSEGSRISAVYIDMVPVGIWPLNLLGIYGEPVTRRITEHLPWVGNYDRETAAWRALKQGPTTGPAGTPDLLFRRN